DFVSVQPIFAVASNCDEHGVVVICSRHVGRIVSLSQFDGCALLQHRGNHHENDQKDEHHVRDCTNVNIAGNFSSTSPRAHSHGLPLYALVLVLLNEVVDQLG